jgi:uncharacterized protein
MIDEESIVVVQGPRACGKTTLVSAVAAGLDREVLDFGLPAEYVVAREDPTSYLSSRPEPVFIDEFQRVPEVLPVLKRSVDRQPRRGAFVLTGSTTQDLLPKGTETLAGRSHNLTLWGLSQGELAGVNECFVDTLFDSPKELMSHRDQMTRTEYSARVARGGFPEAVSRSRVDAKRRWLVEYARRVADRDLAELVQLRQPGVFRSVLELSAARTSDVLNVSSLANSLRAGREAVNAYVELLERVFLVRRLRPYSRNLTARVVRHPKLHLTDSGLATALSRLDENTVGRSLHFGHLLETFVVSEVVKQLGWAADEYEPWYYRDHDGNEVDLVLERADGAIAGVEVKSSTSVEAKDGRGLRRLRQLTGDAFMHGVVLYAGSSSLRLDGDDQITAHPVSALWAG